MACLAAYMCMYECLVRLNACLLAYLHVSTHRLLLTHIPRQAKQEQLASEKAQGLALREDLVKQKETKKEIAAVGVPGLMDGWKDVCVGGLRVDGLGMLDHDGHACLYVCVLTSAHPCRRKHQDIAKMDAAEQEVTAQKDKALEEVRIWM